MSRVLSQAEIDELFLKYFPHQQLSYDFRQNNSDYKSRVLTQDEIDKLFEKYSSVQNSIRFKYDEAFAVSDYDLFYCKYPLEELTSSLSVLRRYAYGDTESFKLFKNFTIIEDYKIKGINAVSVVGVSTDTYELNYNYTHDRNYGTIYVVDATSLSYSFSLYDDSKQTIKTLKQLKQMN